MKKYLCAFMLLITLAVCTSAAERVAVYRLTDCPANENCGNKIQNCLKGIPGVGKIECNSAQNCVSVTFDPAKTSAEAIGKRLDKAGIKATNCRQGACAAGQEVVKGAARPFRSAGCRQAVKANASCRNAAAVPQTKACARVDSACQGTGNCNGNAMCGKGRAARKAVRK